MSTHTNNITVATLAGIGRLTPEEKLALKEWNAPDRVEFSEISIEPSGSMARAVMSAERKVPNLYLLCVRVNRALGRLHDPSFDKMGQSIRRALCEVAGEHS